MKSIVFTMVVLIFSQSVFGKTVLTRNSLAEIEACKGRVELSLVRIWGDENTDDENQVFKFPISLAVSPDGLVYIADYQLDRIQVFDRQANFIRTISRNGQGPGDSHKLVWIAIDGDNNLVVADGGNTRVQAFTPQGKSLYIFRFGHFQPSQLAFTKKGEIVLYSAAKTLSSRSIIYIVDKKGTVLRELGVNTNQGKGMQDGGGAEGIRFALDKADNAYLNYYATPYFHKYSTMGESLMIVTYETPQKDPKVDLNQANGRAIVTGKVQRMVSPGIAIDEQNRIFLIMAQRPPLKEEIYLQAVNQLPNRPKQEVGKTDMYKLLVFNPAGKVIASRQLDIFCENMVVYQDRLFILDGMFTKQIYEYRVTFK